jgi:hypothetical protein
MVQALPIYRPGTIEELAAMIRQNGPRYAPMQANAPVPAQAYAGPVYTPQVAQEPVAVTAAPAPAPVSGPVPAGPVYNPDPTGQTRPRVVDPNAPPVDAYPMNPQETLKSLMEQQVVDTNGRLKSGVAMLGRPTHPTDSLGNAIGQRLGNLATGLINPKADEQLAHDAEIARAAGLSKVDQEQTQAQAELERTRAQTANQQSLPVYRTEQQRQAEEKEKSRVLDQRRRAVASVVNDADEFDPENPKNAQTVADMRELGLPVIAKHKGEKAVYKQDMRTGDWYVFKGDESAPVKNPEGTGQLATTPTTTITSEEKEKDRKLRERLAKAQIASRESIAAQQRAISEQRVKLSKDQFAARYPGYGKPPITLSEIRQMAKDHKMLEEDVVKDALSKGYQVEGLGQ